MKHKLKLIFQIMKGHGFFYLMALVAVAAAALFSFLVPLVIKTGLDGLIAKKPSSIPAWFKFLSNTFNVTGNLQGELLLIGALLVFFTIGRGLFSYWSGKWSAETSESAICGLKDRLFGHIQRLPYDFHVKAQTGDLFQRCTSDVETVRFFLSSQFIETGRTVLMIMISLPLMWSLDHRMTLISLISMPFLFVYALIFFGNVQKVFKSVDESEGKLSTTIQENITGARVVRAFAKQAHEMDKFGIRNRDYRDLTYDLIRLFAGYWSFSDLVCIFQTGIVLCCGTFWAINGSLTVGTLVVFMSYEGMLIFPVRQMGRILADTGKMFVSAGRINEILDKPAESDGIDALKPVIRGDIEFKNVCFTYDLNSEEKSTREVLKNISFKVLHGQTCAILGGTGSGKSTLLHLLPRLYEYTSGSILVDGCELKQIDREWLRNQIGFILQEPHIYARTVRENLTMVREDAAESEIFASAEMAAIHDVVMSFEKGYDTEIGEKGVTLSGGQKQRLALARALLNRRPILVFDDSLSACDTGTDARIRKALSQNCGYATKFIVSHRISTLAEADLILVLKDGSLVQSGTHDQLLRLEGPYRDLWDVQTAMRSDE